MLSDIQMPSGDKTVFDYFVDLQTGEFEPWGHLVPSTQFLIQKGEYSCSCFMLLNYFESPGKHLIGLEFRNTHISER